MATEFPTEFLPPRHELPTSPLQLRDFPSSVERSNANIRPNYDRNVPHNQEPLETEDRPMPQRLVRPLTRPPVERIAEIKVELNEALILAETSPKQYEVDKDAPPSPRLAELKDIVAKLVEQLRQAQAELEAEENKPTALEVFVDSALQLEQSVQFLAGRLLTALTDRALEETFKVSREDAEPAVVKTISKRWKRLLNYQAFMFVHRNIQDRSVSELLVQNVIKRCSSALAVIADILKENK
jgi:hypothetical protein